MFVMTLIHFSILSLKVAPSTTTTTTTPTRRFSTSSKGCILLLLHWRRVHRPGGILEFLGYVVHADRANLANSNVADVANSVINILEKIVFIIVIMCSPMLSKAFGKKTIAVVGFALTAVVSAMFYLPKPTDIGWMIALTVLGAIAYGPTIPLLWAMFADVADYSEWKTGRRATGIVFATIGFALKAGLSIGSLLLKC